MLSPEALAALPQVSMVQDPTPGRQNPDDTPVDAAAEIGAQPMLLMRCGRIHLAIDAMAVHATLSDPVIEPSVLARGPCRGVIDYGGARIAAVDLLTLCGLASTGSASLPQAQPNHQHQHQHQQAFVVRLEAGMVALLIEEVVDVRPVDKTTVMRLVSFALARAELFAGAVPVSALPADVAERTAGGSNQFLVLDSAALLRDEDIASLAQTNTSNTNSNANNKGNGNNTSDRTNTNTGSGTAAAVGRRNMVTYALGAETATPIEQVVEILPYSADISLIATDGPMLGLIANRGRSIPVLCLGRLTGGRPITATPLASVLVVESQGELVGFAVQGLRAIEPSDWEPSLPSLGVTQQDELGQAAHTRQLAQVGTGAVQRMLPVLDLQRIARALQAQHQAT